MLDTPLAMLYSGIMVTMVTTSEKNTLRGNACYLAAMCGGKKQIIFDCVSTNFLSKITRVCMCVCAHARVSHTCDIIFLGINN